MKTFLILDGNSLLHRAWHAIPPLTTKDGRVVNAAYGFTMVIEKMREKFAPDYMAVAWDLPGATFRHEEFEDYKGTREKKEDELYEQIDLIQEILNIYGVPSLSAEGMEADDIVGTIAHRFGKEDCEVLILTGDLDTLQLVNDFVKVVVFIKGLSEVKEYDEQAIQDRYELGSHQLIDLKALMGDSSDNIPGIAGVGKKTATDLLKEYGSIEQIYKAIEDASIPEKFAKKFRGKEEEVEKMKRLVTIVKTVDLGDFEEANAVVREPDIDELKEMFKQLEFKTLLRKYEGSETKGSAKIEKQNIPTKKVVALEEINQEELVVVVEHGQTDLFGNSIKAIVVSDGERVAHLELPSQPDLEAVIKKIQSARTVIGHDVKAILHALNYPIETPFTAAVFDTMVAAYLLSPGTRSFDLETVARDYMKQSIANDASVLQQIEVISQLRKLLEQGLENEEMAKLAKEIEMPLIPVLYVMEVHGVAVDRDRLKSLSDEFGKELDKLTEKIHKLAGREFNINSPSQLAEILFDDLLLPTKRIKRTKTGYSTAASELEKLQDEHEIIPLIGDYRELAKLKSTYADSLPLLVAADGRIHTTYNQTIAATGRLSSINPNLQNIPIRTELGNEIRKAFVAPKGTMLVSMDYSQIELRLAAVVAKDESFLKAFKEGADIHRRTAAEVLGIPEEEVTKEQRYAAKAINFGILYGMGPRNLAKSTGFSREEAQGFLDTYFALHPGIQQYMDEMKIKAHADEYVETLFGRKRYLPDINGGIQMLVAAAERMAINMPLQGTQADLIKMAMIEIQEWIDQEKPNVKMILQVHDALVFEITDEDAEHVVPKLRDIMMNVHAFEVPLLSEVDFGENWGELRKWEG